MNIQVTGKMGKLKQQKQSRSRVELGLFLHRTTQRGGAATAYKPEVGSTGSPQSQVPTCCRLYSISATVSPGSAVSTQRNSSKHRPYVFAITTQ